jgi:predicted PurR-regulated permease PerM
MSIPLGAILTCVAVLVTVALLAWLVYELRQLLILIFLAGFAALLLNPLVLYVQRYWLRRRGAAIALVVFLALFAFSGFVVLVGHPLVAAVTGLSSQLPSFANNTEHGKNWIGQLATRYHLQAWVAENAPKLVTYVRALARPALSLGAGTVSLALSVATFFGLIILMILEGPKLRRGILSLMSPESAAEAALLSSQINRAVVGYMLGNSITSLTAGITIFLTLFALNIQFALLWALWFALLDLVPTIGSILAAIPIILFTLGHSLTAASVTVAVCIVYNQVENHILAPIVMSRTVRISPLLTTLSILLVGGTGSLVDGPFGGLIGALVAIPIAGAMQVLIVEAWRLTAPPRDEPTPNQAVEPRGGRTTKTPKRARDTVAAQTGDNRDHERFYAEQVVLQAERQTAAAEALAEYARADAERTRESATRMLEQVRTDAARERDDMRYTLQANASALEEICTTLRQRAERAELALENANMEIMRYRDQIKS